MTNHSQTTKRRGTLLAALITLFLVAGMIQPANAQSETRLSKKEVMALVAEAKTSQDHERLVSHYKAEALRLEAEAKDHAEMAAMYKKNPGPESMKHPLAYRTEAHCRIISQRYADAAKRMHALSEAHSDMAKKVTK